jgi:hypothetical protein
VGGSVVEDQAVGGGIFIVREIYLERFEHPWYSLPLEDPQMALAYPTPARSQVKFINHKHDTM